MFVKHCEDITSLLAMFARKGKALSSKQETSKGKRKRRKSKREEDEDVELLEQSQGADDEDEASGPLYEKHKIAQAKEILQPFVLRRLKSQVSHRIYIPKS